MMRTRVIKLPIITLMTTLAAGLAAILFILVIVGLFVGVLKELFYYISASQGFSTKSTVFNTDAVNVLITQEQMPG